ncbi:MAG: IS630 family transposase, partial [Pseudomonadota bacterium]
RDIPAGTVVHVVRDTVSSHTTPDAMRWPDRTPRWTVHVTPTSASWPKAVEGFLAKLPERRQKRGVFKSVVDLQAAMNRVINDHDETDANPFTWHADPNEIIAARHRGVQMLGSIQ